MDDIDQRCGSPWPGGPSEMACLIRRLDWAVTPLGASAHWPAALRSTIALMLAARQPMFLWWGESLTQFYNDAYRELLEPGLHPWLLGGSGRSAYHALWGQVGPQVDAVMQGDRSVWQRGVRLPVCRFGCEAEAWWDYGYAPVEQDGPRGGIGGVLITCHDVTARHRLDAELRRCAANRRFLVALDQALHHGDNEEVILDTLNRMLGEHLGANRVGFAEDRGDGSASSARQYASDVARGPGRFVYRDFPPHVFAALTAGQTLHCCDVQGDITLGDDHRAAYRALRLKGMINAPILRDGRLTATLYVHWRVPHSIRAEEIALVEAAARRGWVAVELARARALLEARNGGDHRLDAKPRPIPVI